MDPNVHELVRRVFAETRSIENALHFMTNSIAADPLLESDTEGASSRGIWSQRNKSYKPPEFTAPHDSTTIDDQPSAAKRRKLESDSLEPMINVEKLLNPTAAKTAATTGTAETDKALSTVDAILQKALEVVWLTTTPPALKHPMPFNPVRNLIELQRLEIKAEGGKLVKNVVRAIGDIKGNGRVVGCRIVDFFFERTFLMQCDWFANEKSTETRSIPLSEYTNTVALFHETILRSDPDFTLEETELFLQTCLVEVRKKMEQDAATEVIGEEEEHLDQSIVIEETVVSESEIEEVAVPWWT
ncbi:uncharacterized protein LOC118459123 [Anopheles albimanus]|uniref:DUF4806 domain-containing protein n=1 Tax=Anopheles albimanus TaxID=7167 RepID=A0A182FL08_ANOAL|nr:uncharacterized protein LOC118459123 [Anopheles albimanus]